MSRKIRAVPSISEVDDVVYKELESLKPTETEKLFPGTISCVLIIG
jgi:hypothetical protein